LFSVDALVGIGVPKLNPALCQKADIGAVLQSHRLPL
jgi:hypothetical protein